MVGDSRSDRRVVRSRRTHGAQRARRDRMMVHDEGAMATASVAHSEDRDAWREEIARALDRLPEDQREAFLLKHVEEMSYDEMRELTGASVSALKMRGIKM